MKILVVEDEKKVASFVKRGFEQEGYAVDMTSDGEEGEVYASGREYDIIVLDIMLPKKSGLEVLKSLREKTLRPRLFS